jgi:hypothetical protein
MNFSNRSMALVAGISLVLMALAAGFSVGYMQSTLLVPGDGDATLSNLQAQTGLFQAGIGGWILIFLLDIIVAVALFLFFKKSNASLNWVTAILRLLYAVVLGLAILQFFPILQLVSNGDMLPEPSRGVAILNYWSGFENIWNLGLIVFGGHLFFLGWLALRTRPIPRIWGYLLLIAGVSYTFISASNSFSLLPEETIATINMVLAVPMTIAELGFAIWLIWRGGRTRQVSFSLPS